MSDAPEFSSQNIPTSKPKRRVARKSAVNKPDNSPEINRAINSIYQDDAGHLPNMKKIDKTQKHPVARFFVSLLILSGLLAAAAWIGFFLLPSDSKFSDTKITLKIDGPETNMLGATSTYTIDYRNDQNLTLKNTSISVRYPSGFEFIDSSAKSTNAGHTEWTLGDIAPYKKNSITITGKMYGKPAEDSSWRVFLNYQPENFKSQMQKTAILNSTMEKSAFVVKITGPDKAAVGSEVQYEFVIENNGEWIPNTMYITPILPTNFHLVSSMPKLEKNKWLINLTPSGTTTPKLSDLKFSLTGSYSDNSTSSSEAMKAALLLPVKSIDQEFTIAENSLPIILTSNITNFTIAINGNLKDFSVQPGDTLNFTLNVKNASEAEMNKGQIKINIDSPSVKKQSILDWKAITDKYDADIVGQQLSDILRRGQMIWNTAKVSDLAKIKAGGEVNIDFSIPIRDAGQINLSDYTESKIVIGAEFDYTDAHGASQAINASPITITINSDLKFENRHTMTTADGKDNYDIKWVITNNFHPLKNIRLSANVYGDATWIQPTAVPAGEVAYDPAEKKITWAVASMPDGVDVLALPFNVILNKKNPTQNMLVGKVHVTADDTVTGQSIDFMGEEIGL
ncbi:MAG: hypothetical protein A2261_00345 [Candidatus Magasanikbacteria bacterium RIFOXYA2_FULL_44_8]|uniref:DUF11 domain-containing protein n=1 Tax=Candidatus Magasanikbacteria bacterium RIFOXYA2_FULL_44_8 TaxID=1798696 RepID=A0A1F6NL47_9BACT|nr:MAG: hypothetical protein A2261_00345 [Candidatus Magasanikbacteria bacterium RIFOXYA2_FULL_44_8]